jgi:putative flippase GtrA
VFEKKIVHQFKWFIISGGLATLLNYFVFFMLFKFGDLNSVFSAGVGYISGMFLSFFITKFLAFSSQVFSKRELFSYVLFYLMSLFLNMLFVHLATYYITMVTPEISYVFILGVMTMINFLGCKLLVFKQ